MPVRPSAFPVGLRPLYGGGFRQKTPICRSIQHNSDLSSVPTRGVGYPPRVPSTSRLRTSGTGLSHLPSVPFVSGLLLGSRHPPREVRPVGLHHGVQFRRVRLLQEPQGLPVVECERQHERQSARSALRGIDPHTATAATTTARTPSGATKSAVLAALGSNTMSASEESPTPPDSDARASARRCPSRLIRRGHQGRWRAASSPSRGIKSRPADRGSPGASAAVGQAPLASTCAGVTVALLHPSPVEQPPQTLCQGGRRDLVSASDSQAATDRWFRDPAKVADLPQLE